MSCGTNAFRRAGCAPARRSDRTGGIGQEPIRRAASRTAYPVRPIPTPKKPEARFDLLIRRNSSRPRTPMALNAFHAALSNCRIDSDADTIGPKK